MQIEHCPVCLEPAHPGESDDYGRCASCARIPDVDINGTKYAVVGIELRGKVLGQIAPKRAPVPIEIAHDHELKPETRARIARGIRKYLREAGNAAIEPIAAGLTTRQLAIAQGFSEADADGMGRFAREAVRRANKLALPCNECGVAVAYADWSTHACRPEDREKYSALLDERRAAREVHVVDETTWSNKEGE